MKIKILKYDEFKLNFSIIQKLLKVSYTSNFKISEELCDYTIKIKVDELGEYLKLDKAILIGGFIKDSLIGFIWVYKHDFFGETRLHINQIVVDEDFRGRGIAKKLLTEVEKLTSGLNAQTLDLFVSEENYTAIKLYEDLGYVTERRYLKKKI